MTDHLFYRTILLIITCVSLPSVASAQAPVPTLTPTLGSSNKINSLAFSSDGKMLLAGADDGLTSLWEVNSGAEVKRYKTPSKGVLHSEFFAKDTLLFLGDADGTARILNVQTGKQLALFPGHVAILSHDYLYGDPFAVSLDGKWVFTPDVKGNMAHIWDASTGKTYSTLATGLGDIGYAKFLPHGSLILIAGSKGTALFDMHAGKALWSAKDDTDAVETSQDGRICLTSGVDGVHLRDTSTGSLVKTVPMPSAWHLSLSSDEKRLLAGSFSNGTTLWDVDGGRLLWTSPELYGGEALIPPLPRRFLRMASNSLSP